ncbi:MAG: YicC family protein [Flavobacteriaceae bacterium]|nr:MAG: YicC family protein [Flavobacteriaceae bacterium]
MTGFGKSEFSYENKKISIEVRSLNSKSMDLNLRLPSLFRDKEIELRKFISQIAQRGKVDFSIYLEQTADEKSKLLNEEKLASYLNEFEKASRISKSLSGKLSKENKFTLQAKFFEWALKMPDIYQEKTKEGVEDALWEKVLLGVEDCLKDHSRFRKAEGKVLEKEFTQSIEKIQALLKKVEGFEAQRIESIKTRISQQIENLSLEVDQNRFEQELIYYLEKLDITEEKSRLSMHLSYFLEELNTKESQKGKKLGFISQEIGREINTLGSKANQSDLQKIVVEMKDELEKIKEQVLNVL